MIMAAGLGTRLRPFTLDSPKPLLPLLGVPLLQYSLDALWGAQVGITRVVVNHSHLSEKLKAGVQTLQPRSMEIRLSDESGLLMGSAGGLRKALSLLGERDPFLLLNGDVICGIDINELLRAHCRLREAHGVVMTLAIHRCSPGQGAYRELRFAPLPGFGPQCGRITGLGEMKQRASFFSGYAVVEPEAVQSLPFDRPSEFVPSLLLPAIERNRVGAYVFDEPWLDIGSPGLWLDAHFELMNRMETGRLPALWRDRITQASVRHGNGLWSSRSLAKTPFAAEKFLTPVYIGCSESERKEWASVGPYAVAYSGPEEKGQSLAQGITWNRKTWRYAT
jgi:MurNAc alpha-1-phosphate uridylyltransferase